MCFFCCFGFFCCFFCLCPRLLTWHSSLKFHFKKEGGQERWKLSSPSSWLGGGGGGKECGGSCCGPRAWSGQGFQMWRTLAPVGLAAEPVGDRRNIGQGQGNHGRKLRPAKPTSSTRAATFYLSSPLGEAVHWYNMAVLGKVHFLTRWNHALFKIRFELAPSQEKMSVCNHMTGPWEMAWDAPAVGVLPFAWVGGAGWQVALVIKGVA